MSIVRKILENTFVQILGRLMTAALSLVVIKVISGYLGTAGYGDYTTVYQFLAFFGIIADFGIYTISIKEMSRDSSKIPYILGNVLGLRTILIVFAMLLAAIAVFALPMYRGTLIPIGVLIATLSVFFTLLNGTVTTVLQVHLKMHYATISLVLGKIVSVLYMLWAVYVFSADPETGFHQLLWSGVVGAMINYLITCHYVRKLSPIAYRFDFSYWKHVFFTALPFGVALILSTLYFRIDVLLMTFILPHSQTVGGSLACARTLCSDTENGLLGVAMRMLEMLTVIPVYFMNSVLPIMTRYLEERNEKIRGLMQYSFDFLAAISLPVLVGGFILAKPIIRFVSDAEFLSGHTFRYGSDVAAQILMFAMFFSFLNSLFGVTLVALSKQAHLLYVNLAAVVFNLAGNFFAIPLWGFRGAAAVSVFSELIILTYTYRKVQQTLGFHLSMKTFSRIVFSAFLMGVSVLIGYRILHSVWFVWQLSALVPLGVLIYAAMLFRSKAVTRDMLALLKKCPE